MLIISMRVVGIMIMNESKVANSRYQAITLPTHVLYKEDVANLYKNVAFYKL